MENVPGYVSVVFLGITLLTLFLFYRAIHKNKNVFVIVLAVAAVQALLSQKGFYLATEAVPPRLIFILLPMIILIITAFTTASGKRFIDSIDLTRYTYLHTIRIGVEVVLLWLFMSKTLPESMTFEGRNFDILTGITAPLVAYFGIQKGKLRKKGLLIWNVLGLALVLQVVVTGVLSAPTVLQQTAFDQPNIAIMYFPYIWLPAIIVPIVIFGHLVAIRKAIK